MLFISKNPIYHVILSGGQIVSDSSGRVIRTVPPQKVIFKDGRYETKDPSIIRGLLIRIDEMKEKGLFIGYWVDPRDESEADAIMSTNGEEGVGEDQNLSAELEALRRESAEKDAIIAKLQAQAVKDASKKAEKGSKE